jgi:hypothetical protein
MRRQLAAWIAVAGLIMSACTSPAEADSDDLPSAPVARRMTGDEADIARLVENFVRSMQQRDAHALYALFTQDDQCHPKDIEALLDGIERMSIDDGAEIEVVDITLQPVGATTTFTFDLAERIGASEKVTTFDRFMPVVNDGMRWRFASDVCAVLLDDDTEAQEEALLGQAALEEFRLDTGTYLATPNALRYYASGLNMVTDASMIYPGSVLLTAGTDQALLITQGATGAWYCIAMTGEQQALYGSGPNYDDVALWETCTENVTTW